MRARQLGIEEINRTAVEPFPLLMTADQCPPAMAGGSSLPRCTRVLLLAAVLVSASVCVRGAVLGVDYGSEWLKVVAVKSGQPMISVVPNEMSKRKAPTMVAFTNGERLLGEEAAAILGRYPERVYQRMRDLLGQSLVEAQALLRAHYLAYDLVEDAQRATVRIRTHDGAAEYSVEELVAMVLRYAADLAEHYTALPIKDLVLTVPPFWTQRQRQALLDAAAIAGLKVMALLSEPAAAALQYGIDRKFENATQRVLLYDMGASSVRCAVVGFSAYKGKDRGRSAVISQFHPLGVRWDEQLGGNTMEERLTEHFADEFNAQLGGAQDVRSSPKAMAKLRKAVRKSKEVLSANSEAPLAVEALYEDRDFRSSITRELFEALCADVWEGALRPLRSVLADTNLTAADLDALELIGGATRAPRLQAALQEYLGGVRGLDKHLDADEAAAHGAGLHAANLSDGFKLRPFGVADALPYGVLYSLQGAADDSAEGSARMLFPALRKLPTKIMRSLPQPAADFQVRLTYDPRTQLPPGLVNLDIAAYAVKGVAAAVDKYQANATAPLKVGLHFALSRAGLASLERAEVVVETVETVEPPAQAAGNVTDPPLANTSTTAEPDTADTVAGANRTEGVSPRVKQRKRTLRVPLEVRDETPASLRGLSAAALAAAQARHAELRERDEQKRATAEAKNGLEAYILRTRTDLAEAAGVEHVSSAAERERLGAELSDAEEWLYMDGADAGAAAFTDKLATLQAQGDRIFFRLHELQHRPQILARARTLIKRARSDVASWRESRPWVNATDLDTLLTEVAGFEQWLDDADARQAKRPLTEDPAFACADVDAQASQLLKKVRRVESIPEPKPKPKLTVDEDDSAGAGNGTSGAPSPSQERDAEVVEGGRSEDAQGKQQGDATEDGSAPDQASNGLEEEEEESQGSEGGHDEL